MHVTRKRMFIKSTIMALVFVSLLSGGIALAGPNDTDGQALPSVDEAVQQATLTAKPSTESPPPSTAPEAENPLEGWQTLKSGEKAYLVNGERMTGFQVIEKKTFYFDAKGILQTNWQKLDNYWYYFSPKNGAMAVGLKKIDGQYYYLSNKGIMLQGWRQIEDAWYYFKPGSGYAYRNCWLLEDNRWYYFDKEGKMAEGFTVVGGQTYYLMPGDGRMLDGWQNIEKKWYYLKPQSGYMVKGWYLDNNIWYFLKEDGSMATGLIKTDGQLYYMHTNGAMLTNWRLIKKDWYFFRPGGNAVKGWQYINNVWYYFDEDGKMATGWITDETHQKYYLRSDGSMYRGWLKQKNDWYYLKSNGAMAIGKVKIGDTTNAFMYNGKWIDPTIPVTRELVISRTLENIAAAEGLPYVWGGRGPYDFDCSGLVEYCYRLAGLDWSGGSTEGMYLRAEDGNSPFEVITPIMTGKESYGAIDLTQGFEPGDLIFFRTSTRRDYATGITHVIIYAGEWDGQYWAWHASSANNAIELKNQDRFTLEKGFEFKGTIRLKK